eukprot:4807240-Prymnesium_polylepis.1
MTRGCLDDCVARRGAAPAARARSREPGPARAGRSVRAALLPRRTAVRCGARLHTKHISAGPVRYALTRLKRVQRERPQRIRLYGEDVAVLRDEASNRCGAVIREICAVVSLAALIVASRFDEA